MIDIPGGVPILGQPKPADLVAVMVTMPAPDGKNMLFQTFAVPRLLITAPQLIPDTDRRLLMDNVTGGMWQVLGTMFNGYRLAQEVNGHAPGQTDPAV